MQPAFHLSHMVSDYCVMKCASKDASAFAKHLRKLSQLTWAQIHASGRKQVGFETIPASQLRSVVASAIPQDKTPLVFQTSQGGRIIGYREDDGMFHVVALDVSPFSAYQH